jgi:hypothetical protein
MITLEEFLYLENVDEMQSMTLLKNYNGLHFESPSDFRNFFKQEGIQLRQQKIDTKTEKTLLLERFKSFRGSVDYSNARKYIEEQLRLNKKLRDVRTTGGTIESITSILNNIEQEPADPFFNFVIRKILTGSENGTLPSEELRTILDKLIKESSKEYYDETSDLERDTDDRIKSFKNIFKNKGRIRVPILDERFFKEDFRYIVKTEFSSLPDAVSAEENVLRKASEAAATDIAAGNDNATKKFLSDLSNLINEDGNSVVALKAKIASLEDMLVVKNDIIQDQIDAEVRIDESLTALALESANKSNTIQTLEETNKNLQEQIDTKLNDIEKNIQSQVSSISSAIDNLSNNVISQSNAANAAQDSEIKDLRNKLVELDQLKTQLEVIKNKKSFPLFP